MASDGKENREPIEIPKEWIVGANPDCDVVVDDPSVSGRHCRIRLSAGQVTVEDLNSTNGTYVNGVAIARPTPVRPVDDVRLGKTAALLWPEELTAVYEETAHRTRRPGEPAVPRARSLQPSFRRRKRPRVPWWAAAAAIGCALLAATAGLQNGEDESASADSGETARCHLHASPVRSLAVHPEGGEIYSADERRLIAWDVRSLTLQRTYVSPLRQLNRVGLSVDGRRLLGVGASGIAAWNASTAELERTFRHNGAVAAFSSLSGAFVVAVHADGAIRFLEAEKGPIDHRIETGVSVSACDLNWQGTRLLLGGADGSVSLWDLESGRPEFQEKPHNGPTIAVAISPRGDCASAGADGIAMIFRGGAAERTKCESIGISSAAVHALRWSPGSTRLAGGDEDGAVAVWGIDDGKCLARFSGHRGRAVDVHFLPNGLVLASASADASVRMWKLPVPTSRELKQAKDAAAKIKEEGKRLTDFAEWMDRGKKAVELKNWQAAEDAFTEASKFALAGSIERRLASSARQDSENARRYEAAMTEGERHAKEGRYPDALERFSAADRILPGRKETADAIRKTQKATQVQSALAAPVQRSTLRWEFDRQGKKLLDCGQDFALLLTSDDPPIGKIDSPLAFETVVEFKEAFPDADVRVRIELSRPGASQPIGKKEIRLSPGLRRHLLKGVFPAPNAAWTPGEYRIRSLLAMENKTEAFGEPAAFSMATIHWQQRQMTLTPAAVRESGFEFASGIQVQKGDAVFVEATGAVNPGPEEFCRDLFDGFGGTSRPVGPEGFMPALRNIRIGRYWFVSNHLPAMALLMRVRHSPQTPWRPYLAREKRPAQLAFQLAEEPGELVLSINGVRRLGDSRTDNADNRFWPSESGGFVVRMGCGRLESPQPADDAARYFLFSKFVD